MVACSQLTKKVPRSLPLPDTDYLDCSQNIKVILISFLSGVLRILCRSLGFSSDEKADDDNNDVNAGGDVEHGGQRLISPLLDQFQVAIQSPHYFLSKQPKNHSCDDEDGQI